MKTSVENKRIVELIYKHIIGTIFPEEELELEAWRKASPQHETLYQRLTDIRFLEHEYRRLNLIDTNRPLTDMQARIQQGKHPKRRLGQLIALIATTSIAAMLCIGYFINTSFHPEEEPPTLARQLEMADITAGKTQATLTLDNGTEIKLDADSANNMRLIAQQQISTKATDDYRTRINKLTTPRGGEFKIVLEDSTEVWLNAESQLIYPDNFNTGDRRVTLTGEAYFKVAKDSLRPFYVKSGDMTVRVYGTEFNIHAYTEDKQIYTTLVSGSIALQPLDGSKAELVLTPGHQAIFHKKDFSTSIRSVDTQAATSWHTGRFSFEEQTLAQIMRTLARWYKFDYTFEDERLADIVFKGSAPRYANLSEVLSIMEKSGGIKFGVKEEKIIISIN